MPMDHDKEPTLGQSLQRITAPELIKFSELITQSIDIESLLPKDVTDSGSFDLTSIKNVTFGKLLEAIPIATLLVDSSGTIVFANKALNKIVDEKEILGSPFVSLFDGLADTQEVISALAKIFEERKTQVLESSLHVGGLTLWCRTNLRSVRFKTERLVLVLIEDLTAEKKQLILNEKYQQLVQVFPIGIAEFVLTRPIQARNDPKEILAAVAEAKLVGGNREFARIHGHRAIEKLKGVAWKEMLPFGPAFEKPYFAWIANRFPIRSFETKEPSHDGRSRYYEITLVGNIKGGYLVGLWGMRQDITQRKQTEAALRSARDKLEERVKARTAALMQSNERLQREIVDRKNAERKLEQLVDELQHALAEVKTLSGLLPICAACKKIRDDKGYWTQVEVYVREHSDADFTHSICPECARKLYPDFYSTGVFEP
jgi:PAS domain S-box-containing protein